MFPKVRLKLAEMDFISKNVFGFIEHSHSFEECSKLVHGIDKDLFLNIKRDSDFTKHSDKLTNFVKTRSINEISEKTSILQDNWNKVNDKYFNRLSNFFNNFYYTEFIGYTNNIVVGNYLEDNSFVVDLSRDTDIALYTIMEEILHIIYWKYWAELFNWHGKQPWLLRNEKNGISIWKISEIIPEYIFVFHNGSGREKSYPWLNEVRKVTDPLWKDKNNFKDFLLNVHALCDFPSSSHIY